MITNMNTHQYLGLHIIMSQVFTLEDKLSW